MALIYCVLEESDTDTESCYEISVHININICPYMPSQSCIQLILGQVET